MPYGLKQPPQYTGNFCIDEEVLAREGITDLEKYAVDPGQKLMTDIFIDE